ncbi:MAG TPA: histidine--tRNA ligase [Candidatus Omnitrophica bacterium]|nr:histidine--tRNA ligase [Candidatus Omnitrophota bacterium]
MLEFQSLRGTRDILPPESRFWSYIEERTIQILERFGYRQIRTPIFERTELFVRSIGSSTDIVSKEMYTFTDKKGRSLTLRPEGTAPVVRAYLQKQLHKREEISKLYYMGPFFRYERPQAGRERQFHQIGVEALGEKSPAIDAEIIYLGYVMLRSLNLENFRLLLGSVGCPVCRPKYEEVITFSLQGDYPNLCTDCKRRYETNPLRILDCKNENCRKFFKKLPLLEEFLCRDCRNYLEKIQEFLTLLKLQYEITPHLVRGLDYYTHTTFEFIHPELGAQSTLIGGGRYNHLVEQLGGISVPACGFAAGLERIVVALRKEGKYEEIPDAIKVIVITLGEESFRDGFSLLQSIRAAGIGADMDYRGKSVKSNLRRANKLQIPYTIIIGREESEDGIVKLKNMETGREENIELKNIIGELKRRI